MRKAVLPIPLPRRWLLRLLLLTLVAAWLVIVILALGRFASRVNDAMTFVPSEADVERLFPEAVIAGAEFRGRWGERDRGTWIFDYITVDSAAATTLYGQLQAAGWRVVRSGKSESELLLMKNDVPVHLLLRESPGGLEIMIIVGRGSDGTKDAFVENQIQRHWRNADRPAAVR